MKNRVQKLDRFAILALGYLHFTVLTVASFAGIANLDSELPSTDERDLALPRGIGFRYLACTVWKETTLCARIAQAQRLAGEPLSQMQAHPGGLSGIKLAADWKRWSDATSLVAKVLAWGTIAVGKLGAATGGHRDPDRRIQDACREKDPRESPS